MTLIKQYSIATRQQRSTRIDSDLHPDFFQGLVYHGTAQLALETLCRQFAQSNQRAFTLTGPYGSGKSTIALLLTGLLHQDMTMRSAALEVINQDSKDLLNKSFPPYKLGWLQIRAVGGTNNPIDAFWDATLIALKEHIKTKHLYSKYRKKQISTEKQLIDEWESLFSEAKSCVDGVLLLADEMGKSLEYINKNRGELHLFQDLAEVLGRIETPVIFLGMLHQAFGEYAKDRGTKLQEEWAKIQGRYNDISYTVTPDETVALIAQSITNKGNPNNKDKRVKLVLDALIDKVERKKLLKARLESCAPLHPLTALLLGPIVKRRFSQNERSTFSFLNSHEPQSFHLFLKQTIDKNARYGLEQLWNYLETNLEHVILSSPDGHGWSAAVEAIQQAHRKALQLKAIELLKAIALLTLFGRPANLFATEDMLRAATDIASQGELEEYLQSLKEASCITFRKHLSSWVVFEGSDLDIPALIEEKIEQQGSGTEAIDRIGFSKQIIAKRYYHEVGTLRWAELSIISHLDENTIKDVIASRKGEFANVLLLAEHQPESVLEEFTRTYPSVILVNANYSVDIIKLAKEVYALELIHSDKDHGRILLHDKVAQKEYQARLNNTQNALSRAIDESFEDSAWFSCGKISTASTLSELVSGAAKNIFSQTPFIMNELVNRNKLSGTAVSALKKLLEAMLDNEDKPDLGISGFPPEKSMYISCLLKTSIHTPEVEEGQHWHRDNLDPKFNALFDKAYELLKSHAGNTVLLSEIAKLWATEPYGLTQGVIPIYLLAFLKSLGQDIAFYEKDFSGEYAFIAEPDLDYVHKLIKSPQELAVKYIVLAATEQTWLQQLAVFASIETNKQVANNILAVATPLVTRMHNLPFWVRNAHSFVEGDLVRNKQIVRIRDLFLQANDPHQLLFNDLPKALDPSGELDFKKKIDRLEECFRLLNRKHEQMLTEIKRQVKILFPEPRDELISLCDFVEKRSGDIRLKAFARELRKSEDGLLQWLESMIQIVTGRGKQNWNEGVLLTAHQKISEFAQDFLSIAKSANLAMNEQGSSAKTKLVSLVLEDAEGKLKSYKKQVRIFEGAEASSKLGSAQDTLQKLNLNEFERIYVLQTLLKEALESQS